MVENIKDFGVMEKDTEMVNFTILGKKHGRREYGLMM